jgi:hypothetical protein
VGWGQELISYSTNIFSIEEIDETQQ